MPQPKSERGGEDRCNIERSAQHPVLGFPPGRSKPSPALPAIPLRQGTMPSSELHLSSSRTSFPRALALTVALELAGMSLVAPSPAHSQQLFGKNKIQYTDFRWRVMKTPHIDLHFYPQEEELARWVAEVAEEGAIELMAEMKLEPGRRIPFLLYSTHRDFQQTNVSPYIIPEEVGGLTDLIKGRVLVPHNGSYYRLRWVVRHELVHAIMLEKLTQLLREHKKTRYTYPPLWYVEGLAEFLAAEWDSRADMILRDAVIHDNLVPIDELWRVNGTFLMYKEGQSILLYIAEKYGHEKVLELLFNWWKTEDFDELTVEVLGVTVEELNQGWTEELKRCYFPQVKDRDAVDVVASRIVGHGTFNLAPCPLPPAAGTDSAAAGDELEFVFLSSHEGFPGLRHGRHRPGTRPEDGPEPELLVKGGTSENFESLHFFESALDVNRAREVVFVAKRGARDVLHIVDVDRRSLSATLDFSNLVGLSSPGWSPNGQEIVVSGVSEAGLRDLYVVERDGSGLRALTHDLYDDRDPDWSPDGARIVFASDRCPDGSAGATNLYMIEVATGEISPLTSGPQEDAEPAFSPDGQRIVFRSNRRDQVYDFYLTDLTGKVEPLPGLQTAALDPEWTPDGKSLLLTSFVNETFAIYQWALPEIAPVAPAAASSPDAAQGTEAIEGPVPFEGPVLFASRLEDLEEEVDGAEDASAWEPAAPDTSYPITGYRRRFGLDLIQGGVVYDPDFGGGSGGQLALSDLLGNEQLLFFLANDGGGGTGGSFIDAFDLGFTYFNLARRLNWGVGAFRISRTYNADLDLFRRENRLGGVLIASYPLSKFNRVETSLVVRRISDHLYRQGVEDDTYFISNLFSYVHDATLWSLAGPFDGSRYNLTLGLTADIGAGLGDYTSLLGDYRRYHRLSRDLVFALRGIGRFSFGDEGQRYFIGGAHSLRGFPRRYVAGRRLVLLNQEIRFPLIQQIVLRLPMGPIDLPVFHGTAFVDGAWAGDPEWAERPQGSVGLGIYVGGGPYPRLRVDFSRATDFRTLSDATDTEFSIGFNY